MSLWARTGAAQGSAVSPTGMITAFGSSTPPTGWLLCNGAAVDRTIYAALYTVIGTTWGAGDGSTTFNVPDLTNRTALGAGVITIGTRGGVSSVTLSTANLPAHSHSITDPGHNHTTVAPDSIGTTGTNVGAIDATGGTTGTSTTGITTTNTTGSGASFSILPPYAAVSYIVKT